MAFGSLFRKELKCEKCGVAVVKVKEDDPSTFWTNGAFFCKACGKTFCPQCMEMANPPVDDEETMKSGESERRKQYAAHLVVGAHLKQLICPSCGNKSVGN